MVYVDREWLKQPTYTKLDDGLLVVFRITEEGSECIAVVPDGFEYDLEEYEIMIPGDDAEMQVREQDSH